MMRREGIQGSRFKDQGWEEGGARPGRKEQKKGL
jgi:hypothetical protein